jgi:glycosyltransferase involved in cell wall biosynthesis
VATVDSLPHRSRPAARASAKIAVVVSRRLLLCADSLAGGLGAIVRSEAEWFAGDGWHVHVVAGTAPGGGPDPDVEHIALPTSARSLTAMAAARTELARVIERVAPHVVHCHGLRAFAPARAATRRPVFVTLHSTGAVPGDPAGYHRVRTAALATVPRVAAGAFTVVPGVAGWRFLPHASPRLSDLEVLPFPSKDTRPTFLWVGRLDAGRSGDTFVRAVAAAAETHGARGTVVGDGPGLDALRRLVDELAAPVDLVGATDPTPLLADAWALALFSSHEGVSLAVEEAMWAGRTAVTSPHPGLRWLLGDGPHFAASLDEATRAFRRLCNHTTATSDGARAARRVRELMQPADPWPEIARVFRAVVS